MILLVGNLVYISAGLQKLNKIVEGLASTGVDVGLGSPCALGAKFSIQKIFLRSHMIQSG
jgi:hypothetical protein